MKKCGIDGFSFHLVGHVILQLAGLYANITSKYSIMLHQFDHQACQLIFQP